MWGPNAYSKSDSNLITGPGFKTKQETAQCLDFLHLNLKTNEIVYKGRTPYFLWTCFKAECVNHRKKSQKGFRSCSCIRALTGLLGEVGQHLSLGGLLGFLP